MEKSGARDYPVRAAVIDDHPLYRGAVVRVLGAARIEVCAEAESVDRFAGYRVPPGAVVVLDLKLPGRSGGAAVAEVVAMGHDVLVVSAYSAHVDVLGAIAAGAKGYLAKTADGDDIVRAVCTVAAGGSYFSPALASLMLDSERDRAGGARLELSVRERQVLSLVAAGERDQDIAEAMSISVRTVRSYLDRIRDKTGYRRRPELTRLAIEEGLTTHP
ncbi:LuxR C-terminal-related transcriptional regulator [Amycolatopsis arida]|nr:response regulator transcription factor [Amycolatopsis arida]